MISHELLGFWRQRQNRIGIISFVAVVGLLPLVFRSPYALSTLLFIGIYTIVTQGLCILMGYAGQVSLGQAAFFGLGAYGSAILSGKFGWSPWLAMLAAVGITCAIAYVVGIPILRLQGHYLALGTLAFGIIVGIVMREWKSYTGGATGLPGIPRLTLFGASIRTDFAYYYLVWFFASVGLVLALNIVHSRFGRALRSLRESEAAAESLGIRVGHYKLMSLVVSAAFASVAGSLYVHYMIFVSPGAFALNVSIHFVLMAAVGGMASIWGAPLGAAGVVLLSLVLREVIPLIVGHGAGELHSIFYGALLVVIMIFMPDGLTVAAVRAWNKSGGLESLRKRLPWLGGEAHGR